MEHTESDPRGVSLGLVGASGGLGTSTVAAGLATRAAMAGRDTVLVDLDVGSGGSDLLLGCEREPGPRWGDLAGASGLVDPVALLDRLPRSEHGVATLTHARRWQPVTDQTLRAVRAPLLGAVEVSILDCGTNVPPWIAELDAVMVVVGGTVAALAAAEVAADRLLQAGASPWLVTRGLEERWEAAVSEAMQLPILARIPDDRRMIEDLEVGVAPGSRSRSPLTRMCDEVLRSVLIERERAS
ncbi:hypothetical protein [Demetria terragena]|uniref:hypothetical protein n=1 Tax=Demetria terragena TaxID=63959 RepID=UPI000367CA76|nr:hypothetical protein [Demetria terragena]